MALLVVALGGFFLGKLPMQKTVHPEPIFPLTELKPFVVVMYGYNQALWTERALRSVFEQDYDHYRLIFIDDGSIDQTSDAVRRFVIDQNQESKVILICNETQEGRAACLARAIHSCLDREIIVPLDANHWLSSPLVLSRLNSVYQNPKIQISLAQGIDYPSYAIRDEAQISYYAGFFKKQGASLLEAAGDRIGRLPEPLVFKESAHSGIPR